MVKITKAIGNTAAELKTSIEEHMLAIAKADPDIAYLLAMHASGAVGKVESHIDKSVTNRHTAAYIKKLAMDAAGESYFLGLIFGLKLAELGFKFEKTPEGIKLHQPREGMTH